jgi:hypothetical protein
VDCWINGLLVPLSLALFVAGVGADDPYDTFAANNFAILAKLLN